MSTLPEEARETLTLFREKYERLKGSTVHKLMEDGNVRFSVRADVAGGPVDHEIEGPGSEAVESFALTLRFFLQNNERISIGNLADLVKELPIDAKVKNRVAEGRQRFNDLMDRPCSVAINGRQPSHREVLDVFLYGGLAHSTPSKAVIFEEWTKSPIPFGVMRSVFFQTIGLVLSMLDFLDANFREAIPEYDQLEPGRDLWEPTRPVGSEGS